MAFAAAAANGAGAATGPAGGGGWRLASFSMMARGQGPAFKEVALLGTPPGLDDASPFDVMALRRLQALVRVCVCAFVFPFFLGV
jgi:hypothetical protein